MEDSSIKCFDQRMDTYEIEKLKEDYNNNKLYLQSFDCCDKKSCDALAYEYENLYHKCSDVYGKMNTVNDKGVITNDTACKRFNDKKMELLKKYSVQYPEKKSSIFEKSVRMPENPVTDTYRYGDKKRKTNKHHKKSHKKRTTLYKKKSIKRRRN